MRGKLTRRTIDRLENLSIVLLSCSALLLLGWICTMQHIGVPWGSSGSGGAAFSGGLTTASDRYRPAAIMVQNEKGRYGVQYDQSGVDALYTKGLNQLLENTIAAAERPEEIGVDRWQEAVSAEGPWIWFDYLYDIPCPGWELPDGSGVRGFLITGEEQRVKELYLYSDSSRTFFLCSLNEGAEVDFPALSPADNGADFAFASEIGESLSPVGMLLPFNRDLPVYTGTAPLAGLDANGQRGLMTAMDFNPAAVSLYQTAAGTVIREGGDTLRLEKDGTLIFHSSLGGESRYQAASDNVGDLTDRAMELLDCVLPEKDGMRMVCREVIQQENGDTELRFCCLLGGVEVRFADKVPAARFVFRGSALASFSVRARVYVPAEGFCPVLPAAQASAMLGGLDRTDGELRLCYQDAGSGPLTAGWILRTETEPE